MLFIVQHTPNRGRDQYLIDLKNKIGDSLQVVCCMGNPMQTFLDSLSNEEHWHLEDDVLLAPDFMSRIETIGSSDHIVQGFCLQKKQGRQIPSRFLSLLCVYFPAGYGQAIRDFYPSWRYKDKHPTGFDLLVRDFLIAKKLSYSVLSPSLVQHAPCKSLLGARSTKRQSPSYKEHYDES